MSHTNDIESSSRKVDPWGRVIFKSSDAIELMYRGVDITGILFEEDDAIREYNSFCDTFDHSDSKVGPIVDLDITPEEEHARRASDWSIADEFRNLDVRNDLLGRCKTDIERTRVNLEMNMFEERGLVPVLKMLYTLIDHFRKNNVVWGVGRGSSVSSYCLYLIGVHKVDSIAFDLDIGEFLK